MEAELLTELNNSSAYPVVRPASANVAEDCVRMSLYRSHDFFSYGGENCVGLEWK